MRFEVRHQDHGISSDQERYILDEVMYRVDGLGSFILQIDLPTHLGTVPCGMHGPIMGDAPIDDEDVVFWTRGARPYTDRCIDRRLRGVSYIQAIGTMQEDGSCLLETTFGGPLAPMNPDDPKCTDREASLTFWADHALSIPPESEG